MSVTYPGGFRAAGVTAGFKPSGLPDLGLLVGEVGTHAAGLFTTNRVVAAPVTLARARLAAGAVRAVLVNSGQANAATGERGMRDAIGSTAAAAEAVGLSPDEILPCSTGVIGEPLHVDALLGALPSLMDAMGRGGGDAFAHAIMTTDTVDKRATAEGGGYRVGGCAKGVGMISPRLATMLAFVTTDAPLAPADLHRLACEQLGARFDELTVDGCTSTNDSVLLLASGAAGGEAAEPGTGAWDRLARAVGAVGESLVRQLAADAEGGQHVLLIDVTGAATEDDARVVAKAVGDSPLVKTAAFGGDPNPGRILQAVGSAGAPVDPSGVEVAIGGVPLVRAGVIAPAYFDDDELEARARAAMAGPEIALEVVVGDGPGRSRAIGCDLSYEYVRINGEYTT